MEGVPNGTILLWKVFLFYDNILYFFSKKLVKRGCWDLLQISTEIDGNGNFAIVAVCKNASQQ